MLGAAYGLAVLEPAFHGIGGLRSIYGVAAGEAFEHNEVEFDGNNSFGCPVNAPPYDRGSSDFQRAGPGAPEYDPPPGSNGGGRFDFRDPFGDWAPQCNEISDAQQMVNAVLGPECHENDLLFNPGGPSGGPICDPANPTKALLRGEHQVHITCAEQASGSDGDIAYSGSADVGIVVNIVHVSPDDRSRQVQVLRSEIGKTAPLFAPNPARSTVIQLERNPSSSAFHCSSAS